MGTHAQFIGVEAGGPSNSRLHAAPLTNGSKIGILHGAAQYVIQDKEGQIGSTESISAGLDYPGISPLHCILVVFNSILVNPVQLYIPIHDDDPVFIIED